MDALKSVAAGGSAAVFTVSFIHPIDVVKTRMQVSGDGVSGGHNYKKLGAFKSVTTIAGEEGIRAFWKGIGAAWMREASYTSLRLGLYGPIKQAMGLTNDSNFLLKFSAGSLSGALGSLAGNPFDVVKTRMMANPTVLPPISQCFRELHSAEGMGGFYRGLQANVMRAMVLNGTKMACYDTIKGYLVDNGIVPKTGVVKDFGGAMGAGFFMTCTVAPFDKIRTRLMNQPVDRPPIYTGFLDCFKKIVAAEGPTGLWAGFIPIWSRFAPTTTMQLVIFGLIKDAFDMH